MCGIAGVFNLSTNEPICRDDLRRAVSRLEHRGPDDRGFFHSDQASFGHRRLAVIDVAGGHQPFTVPETGCVLVYNGEIYNHRELRRELAACGYSFKTHCDTETLFNACLEWGPQCLSRLHGMFAFAFYDPREQTLFAARDRLGIKPLFYSICRGRLLLASAMNAMLCLYPETPKIDRPALNHYLATIRTTLGPRTLVSGINALQPGEYLLARQGQSAPTVRTYWQLPLVAPQDKLTTSFDDAAATVHDMIHGAVEERLLSDVPLGGFLSGGLDSTIIAALAARLTDGGYNAYSVGYDQPGYNEWQYINQATKAYGMWCRQIHLDPEHYAADWAFLIAQKGLPLSTPNEVPIYHLARALKHDFTVALSGEGADEVFGGYTLPYFSAFDFDRAPRKQPGTETPLTAALRQLYGQSWLPDHVTHHFLLNSWLNTLQRQVLLTPDAACDDPMYAYYQNLYDQATPCTTLDKHLRVHARVNLEGLLFRVDSSTMAASVEARVPFTDHRIVEYLFSLPDRFKIDWISHQAREQGRHLNARDIDQKGLIESKRLLRKAFATEVPSSILQRRKMSFPVPMNIWQPTSHKDSLREQLMQSPLCDTVFRSSALRQLFSDPDPNHAAFCLWPILNLCTWVQHFGIATP
jgi:asparagine synthase (glutamine-hydrolysing)